MASDPELLAEYVRTRSADAFGAIVERHSALVYSACLRVLRDAHAAEDATQATFLVLMRRAGQLPAGHCLPGWLYTTAVKSARGQVRTNVRRNRREREAADMNKTAATMTAEAPAPWKEVHDHVDAAMSVLPPIQRDALLLRYVCGCSEAEAAQQLGCTPTTLHVRVTRGLAAVREVLHRRGVTVSASVLAGLLTSNAIGPAPAGLAASVTTACMANGASLGAKTIAKTAAKHATRTAARSAAGSGMKAAVLVVVAAAALGIPAAMALRSPAPVSPVTPVTTPVEAAPKIAPQQDSIPAGSTILFQEKFAAATAGWMGKIATAAGAATDDFAVVSVRMEDAPPAYFGVVRSPWEKSGWPVGKHTYLRFRYRVLNWTAKEYFKLMFKRPDQTNFSGVLPKTTLERWETVTVRVNDEIVYDSDHSIKLSAGELLHELVWMGRSDADKPPAEATFWIDDVILFESPVEVPAVSLIPGV